MHRRGFLGGIAAAVLSATHGQIAAANERTGDKIEEPFPAPVDCLAGPMPSPMIAVPSGEMDMDHWTARAVAFDRMQAQIRSGSIPMYGDSITEAMDASRISPFVVPMGINGDTMRGFFNRVNRVPSTGNLSDNIIHRAGASILALGINDICWEKAHNSPANVPFMFNLFKTCATGKWIIVAPLPVNEVLFKGCTNADIDAVTMHIEKIFAGNPSFTVVDAKPVLAPKGQLLTQYALDDGLHPSPAGYEQLVPLIATAGTSLGLGW